MLLGPRTPHESTINRNYQLRSASLARGPRMRIAPIHDGARLERVAMLG